MPFASFRPAEGAILAMLDRDAAGAEDDNLLRSPAGANFGTPLDDGDDDDDAGDGSNNLNPNPASPTPPTHLVSPPRSTRVCGFQSKRDTGKNIPSQSLDYIECLGRCHEP